MISTDRVPHPSRFMRRVGLGFLLGLVAQAFLFTLSLEGFTLLAPICEGNLEGPVPWVCFSPRVLVAGHWSLVADILSA